MRKRTVWIILTLLTILSIGRNVPAQHQEKNRDTDEALIKAWNTKDLETIANIASENFGFGRDVPFPRPPATNKESYKKGLESYFKIMDEVSYESNSTEYRVIGTTGLVWSYYAQTTKQKTGPSRTVYGRQSLTFIKEGNRWKLIFYHRSTLPNEFVR